MGHFNLKQIIKAWIISFNPNDRQKKLAKVRGKMCNTCESNIKNRFGINICNECGCPIGKKIFTDEYNVCDLQKWKTIDKPFFEKQKENKTLI